MGALIVMPTGARFGRWTIKSAVVEVRGGRQRYVHCVCDCGVEKMVSGASLRHNGTTSCGCFRAEIAGNATRTHGMSKHPIYDIWVAMMDRCANGHVNYGARGIAVCDRWHDVRNFIADMGLRPTEKHSIERVNNDGDYSPDNCIWGTKEQQVSNTRRNIYIDVNGSRMPLKQAAAELRMDYTTLRGRLRRGWSKERAISTPVDKALANNRRHPDPFA